MSKKKNLTGENKQPDPVPVDEKSTADAGQTSSVEPQPKQQVAEPKRADVPPAETDPGITKEDAQPHVDSAETPVADWSRQEVQDDPDTGVELVDAGEQKAAGDNTDDDTAQVKDMPIARPSVRRRFNRLLGLAAAVVAVSGGVLLYSFVTGPSSDSAADANLIEKVGQLVVVPSDEVPKVSTVIDPSQTDQPFLANAQKGDKVLLYLAASRAIVYRPSTGQIVNMGPLVQPEPRLFVRNGTKQPVPETFSNKINDLTGYQYVSQDRANNPRYSKTVVVDVSGSRPDVAKRLAEELKVSVGELPQGESRPDADVMVIIGSDISAR